MNAWALRAHPTWLTLNTTTGSMRSKRWLWGVIGSVIIALVSYGSYVIYGLITQHPPGYCAAQKRYISDEEFVRTAIAIYEWDMSRDRKHFPGGRISKKKDDYKDQYQKWEHYRNQSECCSVYRGNTQSIFRRMFGWQEVEVTLYLNPESRGDSQLTFSFDVCGKLLPHEFGFSPESGYEFTTSNYQELTNQK